MSGQLFDTDGICGRIFQRLILKKSAYDKNAYKITQQAELVH